MSVDFLPNLVGSFAQPAAENPTVAMMEAAFRHHEMHWRYINCEVHPDDLQTAIAGAKAMKWQGFNCSVPHKVEVIKYLDGLGQSAEIMQAVNTIVRRGNKWIGENTHGQGFVQAMREIADLEGKSVVIFGAGGAARAVSVELALAGVFEIVIVNRNPGRGIALVDLLNAKTGVKATYHDWNSQYEIHDNTDIVINATTVGLYPNTNVNLNIDFSGLKPSMIVADGIHNPPETKLLEVARSRGCKTLNGLSMLVNQGVIAVKLWTGKDVDSSVMRIAVEKALRQDLPRPDPSVATA